MSAEPEPVEQLVDQYPHRTRESVETDLDAKGILEGYLEHQETEQYDFFESSYPFQAALGRTVESEGYIILTSRCTYPDDTDFSQDQIRVSITAEDITEILEQKIIDEDRVLDGAGVELLEDKKAATGTKEELRPETVHCIVFYDRPALKASDEKEFESQIQRTAVEQSLEEPSLATALIHSGKNQDGEDLAGVQVDYWTRTIDGVAEEGIDYTEINWENPAET